ncbi:MAG TPA: hypothetical protein VK968_12095 [Roseimicrobium sp.]|nr:hypothetical protein [Roseimicrobium sp.]
MKTGPYIAVILGVLLLGTGCKSVLPTERARSAIQWNSYAEAKSSFDKIVPGQTTLIDLKAMGYDPFVAPNVKILTYLDLTARFLPNASVGTKDLPDAVRESLAAQDRTMGYEVAVRYVQRKRFGNTCADIFGFNRKVHETGWAFNALLVIRDGRVVYKLSSGEPSIDRFESKKRPLGPVQEMDNVLGLVPKPW